MPQAVEVTVAWESVGHPGDTVGTTPMPEDLTADLCVVGLGASGLAAALHAARRGATVVAVDASGIAAGAAGRNGGFLLAGGARFHHGAVSSWGRELACAIYRATLDELDLVERETPAAVRRVGSLRIAADQREQEDCVTHLAALRLDGFPGEPYEGPEGTGLLVPTDAVFHPVHRARALAAAAIDAGARLYSPATVVDVGDGRVVTDAGVITADATVVAVDGGLEDLLPELGADVRTARLQMLASAPDPSVHLPRPVYRRWGYDYAQQLPTGEVLLGGCRDRFEPSEWGQPPVPTPEVQGCLDRELTRLGVTAAVTHRWAARTAFTPDDLPVCREVRPGVLAVGAYSGHGNLLGPWCARRAVDAAVDGVELTLV